MFSKVLEWKIADYTTQTNVVHVVGSGDTRTINTGGTHYIGGSVHLAPYAK